MKYEDPDIVSKETIKELETAAKGLADKKIEEPLFTDEAIEQINDFALGIAVNTVAEAIKDGDHRVINIITEALKEYNKYLEEIGQSRIKIKL